MKKILVILVVIGLMLSGAVAIAAQEGDSFQETNILDQDTDNSPGDPAPCGGGWGGGAGSPG